MATAKQQATSQMRTLIAMRDRLLSMSANWADVDSFFESKLERLADSVEGVRRGMDEFRKGDCDGNS